MNREVLYYMWLAESFPYGSTKPLQLLLAYDSLQSLYHDRDKIGHNSFLTWQDVHALHATCPEDYTALLKECEKHHMKLVCWGDEEYPDRLRAMDNPPMVIYYAGDLSCLSEKCVAVVGTRQIDEYGRKVTRKISSELALHGITIVSGCADGADTSAHLGALEHGKTAAVLGTPLHHEYPSDSNKIKRDIVHGGGVVLSEYPPGAEVSSPFFTIRNRLISALSDIVVITQAPARSGACVTAGCAIEQGKELFCLAPPDILNSRYDGVKKYLREGARILLGAKDVLEAYRFSAVPAPRQFTGVGFESAIASALEERSSASDETERILEALKRPADIDLLSASLNLPMDTLLSGLTELEITGKVKKQGRLYQRC